MKANNSFVVRLLMLHFSAYFLCWFHGPQLLILVYHFGFDCGKALEPTGRLSSDQLMNVV